jgi:hypothetical protein
LEQSGILFMIIMLLWRHNGPSLTLQDYQFFINAYAKIGNFGKSDHDLQAQEIVEGNIFQLADQIIEILDKKYCLMWVNR